MMYVIHTLYPVYGRNSYLSYNGQIHVQCTFVQCKFNIISINYPYAINNMYNLLYIMQYTNIHSIWIVIRYNVQFALYNGISPHYNVC